MLKGVSITMDGEYVHIKIKADQAAQLCRIIDKFNDAFQNADKEFSISENVEKQLEKNAQRIAERRALDDKISVQLYRWWRQADIIKFGPERLKNCKYLAAKHNIPVVMVETLLKLRRQKIQNYIKKRRYQIVHRLFYEGKSNKFISKHLSLSKRTIELIIREVRRSKK